MKEHFAYYLENSGFINIVWPSVKSMKQTLNLHKGLANIKKNLTQ